jgi:hypothetical protein
VTAGTLGGGWFVVLLLPSITREWLLNDAFRNLFCLVLASVIVALLCREFISRASTFGEHLIRAALVPYAGCFVYLTLWAAMLWIRSLLFGGLANFHDTISLYAMGFVASVISCFVVVPYGLFCQYIMNSISNR